MAGNEKGRRIAEAGVRLRQDLSQVRSDEINVLELGINWQTGVIQDVRQLVL